VFSAGEYAVKVKDFFALKREPQSHHLVFSWTLLEQVIGM